MEVEDGEGRPCIAQRDDVVKRKKPIQLLLGDKVEVRSVDEGLLGSWHSGVVIECKNATRKVQYDNVLCDDGSQRLDDCISVHPVVDGVTYVGRTRLYYRSFIRPIPPPLNFDRLSIHYGQCVDAYYKEAWWEGVVFDHENTSDVRSILFPDIGDILQVEVDVLRITQDWDEYTRDWKPRGTWHFLQLIENFEQENLLHVSLRQIWYEVREKKAFRILKEWTNSVSRKDIWESLVREVIDDHSKLAAEKYCGEVVVSMLTGEFEFQSEKPGAADNDDEILDLRRSRSNSATDVEQSPSTQNLIRIASLSNSNTTDEETPHTAPIVVPCIANSNVECSRSKDLNVVCKQVPTKKNRKLKWEVDIAPGAEFCPGSVVEYLNSLRSNHRGTPSSLALNMRKHLAYLGWKLETCRYDGKPRMRYTSPNGKAYMSLATVCEDWGNSTEKKRVCAADIVEPVNLPEIVKNNALLGSGENNKNTEQPVTAKPDDIEDKAKRHVMASDSPIRTKEALKTFDSLTTACETYANGEVDKGVTAAVISEPRQKINIGGEGNDKLITSKILPSSILVEQFDSGQVKSLIEGEHHHERFNGVLRPTTCDNDAGAEVNDVSLVIEEQEIRVDIVSLKSTTEEDSKKLDTSLSGSSNSATNVEGFHGALLMNYNKSSGLQGSSPIIDDICPHISEGPAEKYNTGHDLGIIPEVKICEDSVYKYKSEGGTRLDLISSSNSQTTHEVTPCNLPPILPCHTAAVDEFSVPEDLNIVVEESPSKKRRKRTWEMAGRDLVPEAKFCPNSVVEYQQSSRNKHVKPSTLKLNLIKHLAYLAWKIEVCRKEESPRMRYTSPDGKTYMSLASVCKDWDTRSDQCEEKNARTSPTSFHALISSPPPRDIVEPAYLSETVKYYGLLRSGENKKNTAWPRITKPDGIEDVENTHLMASESPICRNEALKTFNFLTTACKTYADGEVDSTVDKAEISDPLIGSDSFPSTVSNEQVETTCEETLNSLLFTLPCNTARVNEFSRLEESNIVGKELPIKKRKLNWDIAGRDVPEANFCPDLVAEQKSSGFENGKALPNLALNTRVHLVYSGWKVENRREEDFSRMYYSAPDKKSQMSFDTVCKEWGTSTEQDEEKKVSVPSTSSQPLFYLPSSHYIVQPAKFPEEEKNNTTALTKNANFEEVQDKRNRHLIASDWSIGTKEAGKQVPRDNLPSERPNNSAITACEVYTDAEVNDGVETAIVSERNQNIKVGDTIRISPSNLPMELVEFEKDKSLAAGEYHNEKTDGVPPLTCKSLVQMEVKRTDCSEIKERKEFALLPAAKASGNVDDGHCSERSVRALDSSVSFHSSRSILSALIDNDVVLPHAKVYYRKKSGELIKEGEITREGIQCNCCQDIFGLSKFEAHTGSTNHRPAAHLFLKDGRSLSECQSQLRSRDNLRNMPTPPSQTKRNYDVLKNIARPLPQPKGSRDIKKIKTPSPQHKRSRRLSTNDYICSVCTLGGQLTFCNHCPSSFHRECLGLKVIPEGEWFCPSCCCGICGKNKFNSGAKKIMDGSVLNCYQCERQYHVGCLLKEGDTNLDRCSEGKWFCNRKCKQIFVGLRRLLGRPVVVGEDNLTWTLLKYTPHDDGFHDDATDLVETLNSLSHAVSVMQECFHPVKEPRTKIDIVKDVIFSKRSNLKRLNFQGFYTVLLSRDDDLISVAAVRVYGEKVAEVPLIGTRFEYRRHGMCRLLMNVLEKKLMELGVERLVFLATPSVLRTWTASFGFSKISESERFNLLSYTFLDFQGTAMCHKFLTNLAQPTKIQRRFCNGVVKSDDTDANKNSVNSEVLQAEQIDVEILHQGTVDVALSGSDINGGDGTVPLILRV